MKEKKLNKIYHPGVFLKDELDARSEICKTCGTVKRLQQKDFSKKSGIPERTISEILNGKRPVTVPVARKLAKALGTSIELWLNLQHEYNLSMLNAPKS